jgi:hypothetical protein
MPRGAKKDLAVTKMMLENHFLYDKRSFVSLDAHLYLYGKDKEDQRIKVFSESLMRCADCRRPIFWDTFEWDHIRGGLLGRCDCLHNAASKCRECHSKKHVQPRWTASKEGQ